MFDYAKDLPDFANTILCKWYSAHVCKVEQGQTMSLLFWTLYFCDQDLILNEEVSDLTPPWLKNAMYTLPTVTALTDILIARPKSESFLISLPPIIAFYLGYIALPGKDSIGVFALKEADSETPLGLQKFHFRCLATADISSPSVISTSPVLIQTTTLK
ncbi:hypothetical protein Aperf_G00000107201 [Anoplocephala perfoliata]